MFDEWRPIDRAPVIEGQTKVFGERAFTRSVEARNPDPDLVFSASRYRQPELSLLQTASDRLVYRRPRLLSRGADAAGGTSDPPLPRIGITVSAASTPDLNR